MSNPIQQAIEALEQAQRFVYDKHYPIEKLCAEALSALQSLQGVELPEPMAWLYENHADGVQAFTNEPPPRLKELCKALYTADQLRTAVAAAMARGAVPRITPAQAMDALKEAFAADPSYAWTWHCGVWAAAHDEGMETSAANRAAARLMSMAFDVDTSKHENFAATQAAAPTPEATQPTQAITRQTKYGEATAHFPVLPACPMCKSHTAGECSEKGCGYMATQPTQVEAPSEPTKITDAMVDAYLKANDEYWRRTDQLPTPPNKWRTGTVREATQESLAAALATQQAGQVEAVYWQWRRKKDAWSTDKIFNTAVFATTSDSEVRSLYTTPPAPQQPEATQPTQAEAPSEREAWPVMPPSKGQSPILFEDGYAEGWAKCLAACQEREAALATQQAGQGEACCVNWAAGTSCFADPRQDCPRLSPMARSMDAAPRDGTMLRLLVDFDESSFEDSPDPAWTIGFNNLDNTGDDRWQFAGWCWTHDHITEGGGTPIGWLPMLDTTPPAPQQPEALAQQEREWPQEVLDWVAAESIRIAAVHTYNDAQAAAKQYDFGKVDLNQHYQRMNATEKAARQLIAPMHAALVAAIRAARSSEGGA